MINIVCFHRAPRAPGLHAAAAAAIPPAPFAAGREGGFVYE
ncbi:hypothetical protein HMPREF0262_03285 [Clostridium sp. ATCC 29733]|nr:hypothetical protein HMPREF0262_03285 [Clostridium sp. ATCC 29733]